MKLVSCDNCGVVLDQDKLSFAIDMFDDDGCIDPDKARLCHETRDYTLFVPCPVCESDIFKE